MASRCVVSDDSSGLSSSDEFGWNVEEISDEKQAMLIKDIRMALSGESTPSSESEDDCVPKTQIMQSRLSANDSLRLKDNRKIVVPKLISNTVSDSDTDDFRERTLENKRNGRLSVVVSGDSAVMAKDRILNRSVVCSSSCTLLQAEEVVGVDVNHVTIDNSEPALFCEDITEDDEVWLVQCPNNVNPHTLKEKSLLSPGTSKITAGQGQVLEVSSYSQCSETQTILLPSRINHTCSLVVLKPAGQIVIREHIDTPHPTVNEVTKKKITFPVGLKMRHPLLGADYEKELQSYTESLERFDRHHKQKKKKRKHKTDIEFSVNDVIVGSKEEVHKPNKKRKLFCENTYEDTVLLSGMPVANEDFYSSHSSKSKKRKKQSNSLESTLSVQNTEECNAKLNEFFSKPKKKRKHKSSEIEESPSILENSKKDRKRKRDETETSFEMSSEFSEKVCEKDFKKKRKQEKKKRRLDIVVDRSQVDPKRNFLISEENIKSAPLLEPSRSSVSENDRDTTDTTEHRENSATESLADLRHTKKKKKKKKKERNSAENEASTHHSMI